MEFTAADLVAIISQMQATDGMHHRILKYMKKKLWDGQGAIPMAPERRFGQ